MATIFYAGATSLLLSFLLMPLLTRFLRRRQVLDVGGRRKIHKGFIPSMGGIIICVAFLLAILLWVPINDIIYLRFEFAAIALVFFTGIRDDIEPLRPMHKLLVQIIAAGMVVIAGDIRVVSFYGLLGIEELPIWLSYCGSMLFIIFITNAFNLIDGVDGLAGSIAVAALSFLCFWFYGACYQSDALQLACIVGAVIGFLYYNWQPASIFMGDTGSLVIGFILSVSTLTFISVNGKLPYDHAYKLPAVLGAGVAVVLLPAFDTIRVFILRLRQGKSPFLPDKQHIHHVVLRIVHTHARTAHLMLLGYILVAGQVLLASRFLPDWLLLLLIIVVCVLIDIFLFRFVSRVLRKERKNRQIQGL
jgi:UDP-N-acetylmuramyl pentapeptide phosphotransferase/UDP-N-acetylglucosamine-1-phosphate transferase